MALLVGALSVQTQDRPADGAHEKLVLANRILAMEGLIGPFGHVSVRLDPARFLIAAHTAGASITTSDLVEVETDVTADAVKGRGLYSEIFIHSSLYDTHAAVNAVVHTHSPYAVALGTLKHRGGRALPTTNPGSNLGNFVPIFPEVGLIQTAEQGRHLAGALQGQNGVLLRGHGAVVVGETLEQAVLRAIYLELEAQIQMLSRAAGEPVFYRTEESDLFKATRAIEHPWDYYVEKLGLQAK